MPLKFAAALGAALALLPALARAQDRLPGVLQTTLPAPATRGYYGSGWVRVPLSVDAIVSEGKGWDYTAGAGSIGVHLGATTNWYVDATGGGGFGSGHVFFNGKKSAGNFSGNHLQATLGRKVYLSHDAMAVAFAGANWGSEVFTWKGTQGGSPDDWTLTSRTVATPAGVFLNYGREFQIVPSLMVTRVWTANTDYALAGTDVRVKFDPYVSETLGFEMGSAMTGIYFGAYVQATPAMKGYAAETTVMAQLTWALKMNKAAGVP